MSETNVSESRQVRRRQIDTMGTVARILADLLDPDVWDELRRAEPPLWSRRKDAGPIENSGCMAASIGPEELDFGHFRYNLLGDFGFAIAERFLGIYRAVTGTQPNAFWEALNFAPDWATCSERAAEGDAYAASLLARLT
jgi:hypothetical protein